MNIYVGNLPYKMTDAELRGLFAQHGEVNFARVITEQETGRSKGFGFVEMNNDEQANAAITALNGFEMNGRKLTVNQAREREQRPRTGGGNFRGPRRGNN